ncbi:MAG: hypothetical protein IKM26_01840 [Clostridia bacterium]|nr:hypothetical protein [Clostridiales bacterium]MBR6786650.1 hypothetical protein [Clostridia bacterium]
MECKWLPELIPCTNWAEFSTYEQLIYSIFKRDFIDSCPSFESKPVNIRREPKVDNREQAFFHVTSREYKAGEERMPDNKRCERIKWIRAFIEHYDCDPCLCESCEGIKVWEEPKGNNHRILLYFEEEDYVVVLERRDRYVLLITAYYVDYSHTKKNLLKRYNQYNKTRRT